MDNGNESTGTRFELVQLLQNTKIYTGKDGRVSDADFQMAAKGW